MESPFTRTKRITRVLTGAHKVQLSFYIFRFMREGKPAAPWIQKWVQEIAHATQTYQCTNCRIFLFLKYCNHRVRHLMFPKKFLLVYSIDQND